MKSKLFVPIMLIVFMAGSAVAMGQDSNQKKIERLERKIEKQTKKLQELTGEETVVSAHIAPPVKIEDIQRIKVEARAAAEEARENVREAMEEQREALDDQREQLKEHMIVISEKNAEKMKQLKELNAQKFKQFREMEVKVRKNKDGKNYSYYYKVPNLGSEKGGTAFFEGRGDINVDIPDLRSGVYHYYSENEDNLSINKELTDETSTADFNYEVREGAGGMSVIVNGAIDSGKVTITIKRPDGELYNEYILSPLANVKWNQTLKFEDQKESEYLGKWTVTVAAENARGNYSVLINGR